MGDLCRCDVNAAVEAKTQRSALSVAVNMGHVETARVLVHELGACVDHQDQNGLTPLMLCCASGRRALADLLVRAGADPARQAHSGQSALDMCATPELRDLLNAAPALSFYELAGSAAFSFASAACNTELSVPCLQFPASARGRCVRFGQVIATGAPPVDVALKCSRRRADVENELAVLRALPDGGPFIRLLCADVLTFRPVSAAAKAAEASIGPAPWYGIALEQGACDVQRLGVALAEARDGAGPGGAGWALRRHLARQCCEAIRALHAAGFVWCDCKPANFVAFVRPGTGTGRRHESPAQLAARLGRLPAAALAAAVDVKAIDLGGCRPRGEHVPAELLVFTVKFAAPELARAVRASSHAPAAAAALEESVDLWSAGALLLQLAHPAFEPFSLARALEDHTAGGKPSALSLGRLETADLAALQADVDAHVDAVARAAADEGAGADVDAAPLLLAARAILRVDPEARASLQDTLQTLSS